MKEFDKNNPLGIYVLQRLPLSAHCAVVDLCTNSHLLGEESSLVWVEQHTDLSLVWQLEGTTLLQSICVGRQPMQRNGGRLEGKVHGKEQEAGLAS